MQLMRNCLNRVADFDRMVEQLVQFSAPGCLDRGLILQLLQLNGEHGDALINVIMELAGNVSALFFLSFDQLGVDSPKRFLCRSPVRFIRAGANVAYEGTVRSKSWNSVVYDPAILAILVSQTVMQREGHPGI